MNAGEVIGIDVGIDLGGGDVGVAEKLLDDAQIGAVAQHVTGKGVAQDVGVDVFLDAGGTGNVFDDLPDPAARHGVAIAGEEQLRGIGSLDQQRAKALDIAAEMGGGVAAKGNDPGLFALARYPQDLVFQDNLIDAERTEFADAEPAGVEKLKDQVVAAKEWIVGVAIEL